MVVKAMPMFLRRTHRIERSVDPAVWNDPAVLNDEEFEILERGALGSEERAAQWDEALITEIGDGPGHGATWQRP